MTLLFPALWDKTRKASSDFPQSRLINSDHPKRSGSPNISGNRVGAKKL